MKPRPKIRLLLTIVRVYKLHSLTYLLQSLIIISPAAAAAAARVVVGLRCTTDDLSTVITFGANADDRKLFMATAVKDASVFAIRRL